MERKYVILSICAALLFASLACGMAAPTAASPVGATVPADGETQLPITPGVAHITDSGFLKIPGSVENRTGEWIGIIIIEVKLYDKDNNLLMATSTTGETDQIATMDNGILAPGETGYFMYLRDTSRIQGKFDHFALSATANGVSERGQGKLSDVKKGATSETYIEVSGKFGSVGQATCFSPTVVAVGYTADGKIYEVASSYPTDQAKEYLLQMKIGLEAPFQFYLENDKQQIVKIEMFPGCNVE